MKDNIQRSFVNLPVKSDTPFPEIVGVTKSSSTVQILKKLAYSRESEMTATTTYLHQDWELYPFYPEIANVMEQISITEMTHLDALSNAIVSFGGNADYYKDGNPWTAQFVAQGISLPETMQRNIDAENAAIYDYEKAIENVSNESLKQLFRKIIQDEKAHIAIFNAIIEYLKTENM